MDKIENNIDRKITRYLVQFNDSMYDFHKKIEKSNDYKENNLDTKNVYKGYYEVQKRYISKTGDIIKDITEYSFGEINQELYESVYDSYDNILRKEIYQNRISNYGIEENIRKFIYKNIYEDNRLIRTVEIDVDDDYKEVSITDYEYENNLLIKKNIRGYIDETTIMYYHENNRIFEEVLLNGRLSHYYQYNTLEDGRVGKTLVNPARGKYKWRFKYNKEDIKNCEVYMHEPILTADMIKEIMDYIIANYKDTIDCVIIDILNINLLYRYENPEIYNYYRDNYGIVILEDF